MAEFFKPLLELLKLSPRYLAPVGVGAAFLVFGSEQLLQQLGLLEFANDNRAALGGVFVFTAASGGVSLALKIAGALRRYWKNRCARKRIVDRLHRLTEAEKQILRYYIAEQTRSSSLHAQDGVVQGLVSAGIIYLAFRTGNVRYGFPYNITEFAWDYLNVNQVLLIGETNTYRHDGPARNESRDSLYY